jgi:hypothetical protein
MRGVPADLGYDLARMLGQGLRIRAAAVGISMIAALAPAAAADAAPTLRCKSADLRYPFSPGGPKTFGVFRLRIIDGRCTTAHRVAKDWMDRFEANLDAGRVKLPRSVDGFTFTTLPATEAQTYRERGRRGTTTIRFDYRVPNG